MSQGNPDSPAENPEYIHQNRQTTSIRRSADNSLPEGTQRQQSQFKGLQSKRNANNRNHQQYAAYNVFQTDKQSAQNNPKDVQ